MIMLAVVGITVLVAIVGYGVYGLSAKFTLKQSTDRYRYVKTKDENGNEITKVVDLEDEK
jgi:predicted NAD/FAD-binding protein